MVQLFVLHKFVIPFKLSNQSTESVPPSSVVRRSLKAVRLQLSLPPPPSPLFPSPPLLSLRCFKGESWKFKYLVNGRSKNFRIFVMNIKEELVGSERNRKGIEGEERKRDGRRGGILYVRICSPYCM
jgi:hypothetical protein